MNKVASCPICEKESELDSSNQYRPFCSKRCRLIDLGQWINESYAITESRSIDNGFEPDTIKKH
ncbi:MAG: DNA gyrase inhibitor YacG [Proteobacteria bacterium]|nr:DNA gyrase inhibitor YacG [Pseudomonadota bacterium]NOG60103.1 DNA gyrase inhibitor YacG [Pseudomonadota bacterium]